MGVLPLDNINLVPDSNILREHINIDGIEYLKVTKPLGVGTSTTSYAGWSFDPNQIPDKFKIELSNVLITDVTNVSTILLRVLFVISTGNVAHAVTFTKDTATNTYYGSNEFTKPENATAIRIYPTFTASSYVSNVSVAIPTGALILTDLETIPTIKDIAQTLVDQNLISPSFNTAVENIVKNTTPNISQIDDLKSAFSDKICRGELLLDNQNNLVDTNANYNYISWWGSSTLGAMGSALNIMSTDLGITNKYAGGRGGELMQHHAARMGAVPALLKFTGGQIPESGSVAVTSNNLPKIRYDALVAYPVTVNGVNGTLGTNTTNTGLIFTRTEDGSAITVNAETEYEAIPTYDEKFISGYVILNVGKNNILYKHDSVESIFEYTMKMYAHVRTAFKRVLVMNHYNNTNFDNEQIAMIAELNRKLSKQFGNCLIDNYGYLKSTQVWIDTGITPTEADLAAQARGVLPPSLSSDALHMNSKTYTALINKKIKPKFQELWIKQE